MNGTLYIRDARSLADYCAQLTATTPIAMDLEFTRRNTWRAQLSLLQLFAEDEVALIDLLAIDDLTAVNELFARCRAPFVMHAPQQDYEILTSHYEGDAPRTIYDTQLAAAFLGLDFCASYKTLASLVLGVTLDKSEQTSDWSRRPLSATQLRYAANDVIHLPALWNELESRLRDGGRWQWYLEETDTVRRHWVKQSERPAHDALSLMLAWREEEAKRQNIPSNWVLHKQDLRQVLRLRSPSADDITAVVQRPARASASRVHEVLRDARARFPRVAAAPPIPKPIWSLARDAVDALAQQHGIASTLLASREQLKEFLRRPASLTGWRAELLRPTLERMAL